MPLPYFCVIQSALPLHDYLRCRAGVISLCARDVWYEHPVLLHANRYLRKVAARCAQEPPAEWSSIERSQATTKLMQFASAISRLPASLGDRPHRVGYNLMWAAEAMNADRRYGSFWDQRIRERMGAWVARRDGANMTATSTPP